LAATSASLTTSLRELGREPGGVGTFGWAFVGRPVDLVGVSREASVFAMTLAVCGDTS
jgi:hypothetical protein